MIFIAIVIGCILGAIIGIYAPMVPYTYSGYLAIAIIAALDSVFGGISATLKRNFDLKVFVSGFFGNAILSIILTYLGQKLNVDIYLAAIVVFVGRMFNNLAIIRRYYLDKWSNHSSKKVTENWLCKTWKRWKYSCVDNVSKILQKYYEIITNLLTFFSKWNIISPSNRWQTIYEGKQMEEWVLAIGDIIVGIDIGTSKVSLVIGEVNNFNQIEVICTASHKCNGIQKGKIIDENEIGKLIHRAIKEAESEASLKINSAYVTIPGRYVTIVQNSISKDARDKYAGISAKDVATAILQVRDIDVPDDKQIIDIVENQFILENGKTVADPIGNLSGSFTLKAQVILADKEYMRQIANIFRKANLDIDGLVPTSLAQRSVALDSNELNDNVMLLDIGAGNTDIGVFEGSSFVYTNTIPLGGDNITSDIAYVLNISREEADKLKKQYGLALKSFIDNDNEILLTTCKEDNR